MFIKKYKNYVVTALFALLLGVCLGTPGVAGAAADPSTSSTPSTASQSTTTSQGNCTSQSEPGYLGGQAGATANCDPVTLSEEQKPLDCGSGKNGSFVKDCSIIDQIVKPTIQFLSVGFGILVTGIIMVAGLQYSAAGGDPQKVADAKKRIGNALFALVSYLLLLSVLSFLIPGGLL